MNFWQFLSDSPILAFFLALIVAGVVKYPFHVIKRYIRSKDIQKHGWPKAPIDADGDLIFKKKEES